MRGLEFSQRAAGVLRNGPGSYQNGIEFAQLSTEDSPSKKLASVNPATLLGKALNEISLRSQFDLFA
jgi:hypothetical protein